MNVGPKFFAWTKSVERVLGKSCVLAVQVSGGQVCKPDSPTDHVFPVSYEESMRPVRQGCQWCHLSSDSGHTMGTPPLSVGAGSIPIWIPAARNRPCESHECVPTDLHQLAA